MGDWLAREGWMIVSWWMLVTLAGAAALPLAWRMLASLPDRGYLLARPLGLLLTGAVFWLLNILGFLRNEAGGVALSALIVFAVGLFALYRASDYAGGKTETVREWWARNRGGVIVGEIAFALMFFAWSVVKAHNHEVVTTEKPMDLAFMASIVRSATFPPNDPWLSGYAISYYHFGYVIAAMLAKTSGVIASIGYNLWTAMLFALTGLSAFGVVYNLVRVRGTMRAAALTGLVGLFAVAVMGNYQTPFVDEPYYARTASPEMLEFWDVRGRLTPLGETSPTWQGVGWWWWASARVIHDHNLPNQGGNNEVINEFPMFSYILADNHPHVMALPFALLAMGIGLSVALNRRPADARLAIFCGVTVGALIFLNTWDAPIYIALVVGAEALRRYAANGRRLDAEDGLALVGFGGLIVGVMLLFYLPFLVSFGSQLGGVLPNLLHPTATQQIFLVFGALFPLTILFLGVEAWRGGRGLNIRFGLTIALGILILLVVGILLLLLLGSFSSNWLGPQQEYLMQTPDAVGEMMAKRVTHLLTTVLLAVGIFVIAARLFGGTKVDGGTELPYSLPTAYALLLIGGALLLILVPDYIYLRDGFSQRMNTVFKFYYQAWALLGVGCAYGVWSIVSGAGERPLPNVARGLLGAVAGVLLVLGLSFPLRAIPDRMTDDRSVYFDNFGSPVSEPVLSLDGGPSQTNPNDYAALICLKNLTDGQDNIVVAEVSFGGGYDYFNRGIASGRLTGITGLPSVLGWQGHERQWRGQGYAAAVGTRESDIRDLYQDMRLDVVRTIIDRYSIDYIVFGDAERARYGSDGELKFRESLDIVCESGSTRIYRTPAANPAIAANRN